MSALIASLGMYAHAAQAAANDRLWSALARNLRVRGIEAPARLDRTRPVEAIWRDSRLLLGQACGYPLVCDPDLALRVVAVPVYDVPGCTPGRHFSHIVARNDDGGDTLTDHVGRRVAINAAMSNSGCNLLRAALAGLAIDGPAFALVIETGSHRASVAAVRDGQADVAAIDAVTWAALARFEPEAIVGLRIIGATPSAPALPFVTARATPRDTLTMLRAALAEVAADPALAGARDALFLRGIVPAGLHRFVALRRRAGNYPRLQ